MNATSILIGCIICAAASAPAAQAQLSTHLTPTNVNSSGTSDGLRSVVANAGEAVTASGPKKLVDTYMATAFGAIPLLPGFTVLDTSTVNCPNNAPACTIGFESMVQVMGNGDIEAICLKVDNMAAICHYQTLVSTLGTPAIVHAREAVQNLAPGPHTVQTLMRVGAVGNTAFFFHTDYRVYKP